MASNCPGSRCNSVPDVLRIRQIDHVVLRVSNLERMLDFYLTVIGCTPEKDQADIGLYQVRAGSSLIDLVPEGRNLDHFCLRIDPFDTDEVIRHLRKHGVEPGAVESRYGAEGDGPSIYVTDPEGNIVELKGAPWPQPR
jgi:glyoxylase I family protein